MQTEKYFLIIYTTIIHPWNFNNVNLRSSEK